MPQTVGQKQEARKTIYTEEVLAKEHAWIADKFIPQHLRPGIQERFLSADEDEVLSSGSRGSGKSATLIIDPLRHTHNKNFRALIIRRTMPELRDLINRAKPLYQTLYPSVKWKEQEKIFIFPSGAIIEFGYCAAEDDVMRYHGQEYTYLAIDEITQFPDESVFEKLKMSVRTSDPTLKTYIRLYTNPGGPGQRWVKERFVDLGPAEATIRVTIPVYNQNTGYTENIVVTRKWFHSTVFDNYVLQRSNPMYVASLSAIDNPVLRAQWLEGSWDEQDGVAFPEFKRKVHVVEPFPIPGNWMKFRATDWGYSSMGVCLWFAIDYDHTVYIYREFCFGAKAKPSLPLTPAPFVEEMRKREGNESIRYSMIDGSVGDNRGSIGPTIDEQLRNAGLVSIYADKSAGSRIAGKNQVHKYLQVDPFTGQPKIKIFNTCKELIAELSSLPIDKNNSEDVDTDAQDHAYDALRYGLMSRPEPVDNLNFKSNVPEIVDSIIGY